MLSLSAGIYIQAHVIMRFSNKLMENFAIFNDEMTHTMTDDFTHNNTILIIVTVFTGRFSILAICKSLQEIFDRSCQPKTGKSGT